MFTAGYFPGAYFTEAYFPRAEGVAAEANHFPHGYFPDGVYPDSYFPGQEPADTGAKPLYFAHRYFTLAHFPDAYFPGQDGAPDVVIPGLPAFSGGERRFVRPPVVRAWVRVVLPAFEMDLRASSVPARMSARVDVDYRLSAHLEGTGQPASMQVRQIKANLRPVELSLEGTSTQPRRVRRSDDDELVEHYMLSVGGSGKD